MLDSGAKTVVITSIEVESLPGKLVLLAKNNSGKKVYPRGSILIFFAFLLTGEKARVEIPKIPAHFTGTGDLFTALLLAWGHEGLQVQSVVVAPICSELNALLECM